MIGRYRIEREIGRGGMAVVYLAHQLDLDRSVALKELAGFWAADATALGRFRREAKLVASLNHRNIVIVHEYFEHDGVPYIAMELLVLGSLRTLVGRLSLAQAIGALDGILAGLRHACEHGIVHRDLKPENVMRAADGTVKIADFGIARGNDGLAGAHVTPPGVFLGAPAYVSPEQVVGAEATAASDLYSVGVMAFELLSGDAPFADAEPSEQLLRKINERAPSVRTRRPDIDRGLADWVDRLLDRDPAKRPRDPSVAAEALEEIAERVLGARWRSHSLLPEHDLARVLPPSTAPPTVSRFVSLSTLRRRGGLAARAARSLVRPFNIALPAVIALGAAVLDSRLLLVAVAAYLALGAITFFEERVPVPRPPEPDASGVNASAPSTRSSAG